MFRPYEEWTQERLLEELERTEPQKNMGLGVILISAGIAAMYYWLRLGFWIAIGFFIALLLFAVTDNDKYSKRQHLKKEINRR